MSLLFTWDLMVLTFTEVKLCFFLAFKVGKVVKLRFLGLFASIGVLQEREREQKIKLALEMEVYASNTSTRDLRKESLKFKVALNYLSRPHLRDGGGDSGGRSDDNTIARQQQG